MTDNAELVKRHAARAIAESLAEATNSAVGADLIIMQPRHPGRVLYAVVDGATLATRARVTWDEKRQRCDAEAVNLEADLS